jgi:hypothetical protein
VYLYGETVEKDRRREDAECLVVALKEHPGNVSCRAKEHLAAISTTEDDKAWIDLFLSIQLKDPIEVLRRFGGEWKTPQARERSSKELNQQVTQLVDHRLREIFINDKIQLWSREKREVADWIFYELDRDLKRWGLRIEASEGKPSLSIVRRYPNNLYEIALQFGKAELLLLEAVQAGRKATILKQLELVLEDLMAIQSVAEQGDRGSGAGLFLAIKDKPMSTREKVSQWLEIQAGATAASFLKGLYSDTNTEQAIRLSEQVLLAAFRNPVLGLGEWLDMDADRYQHAHYRHLQSEFDKAFAGLVG